MQQNSYRDDDDDFYGGFDSYDQAYDIQNITQNAQFQQAVARSSHGRRPVCFIIIIYFVLENHRKAFQTASQMGFRDGTSSYGKPPPTMLNQSRMGGRTAMANNNEPARPMTAVRGAGYTSFANRVQAAESPSSTENSGDSGEEKCKQMEAKVMDMLKESMLASEKKKFKEALDKGKEAGRRERAVVKYREQQGLTDNMNLDLTFTVLFNLAQQYEVNDMTNEALNTYEIIVRNKMFPNSGRLRVNIGNIYFKRREFMKALKYYRMAQDQVPAIQKAAKSKIANNVAIAFVKIGSYDTAIDTLENSVEDYPEFTTALNLGRQ
uniref:TPR_REGION domain-containing protein n=1 Tax=Caenorhabditis tropicalis TaxID=1561998 RepID=A0A1I7TCY4_9PELO